MITASLTPDPSPTEHGPPVAGADLVGTAALVAGQVFAAMLTEADSQLSTAVKLALDVRPADLASPLPPTATPALALPLPEVARVVLLPSDPDLHLPDLANAPPSDSIVIFSLLSLRVAPADAPAKTTALPESTLPESTSPESTSPESATPVMRIDTSVWPRDETADAQDATRFPRTEPVSDSKPVQTDPSIPTMLAQWSLFMRHEVAQPGVPDSGPSPGGHPETDAADLPPELPGYSLHALPRQAFPALETRALRGQITTPVQPAPATADPARLSDQHQSTPPGANSRPIPPVAVTLPVQSALDSRPTTKAASPAPNPAGQQNSPLTITIPSPGSPAKPSQARGSAGSLPATSMPAPMPDPMPDPMPNPVAEQTRQIDAAITLSRAPSPITAPQGSMAGARTAPDPKVDVAGRFTRSTVILTSTAPAPEQPPPQAPPVERPAIPDAQPFARLPSSAAPPPPAYPAGRGALVAKQSNTISASRPTLPTPSATTGPLPISMTDQNDALPTPPTPKALDPTLLPPLPNATSSSDSKSPVVKTLTPLVPIAKDDDRPHTPPPLIETAGRTKTPAKTGILVAQVQIRTLFTGMPTPRTPAPIPSAMPSTAPAMPISMPGAILQRQPQPIPAQMSPDPTPIATLVPALPPSVPAPNAHAEPKAEAVKPSPTLPLASPPPRATVSNPGSPAAVKSLATLLRTVDSKSGPPTPPAPPQSSAPTATWGPTRLPSQPDATPAAAQVTTRLPVMGPTLTPQPILPAVASNDAVSPTPTPNAAPLPAQTQTKPDLPPPYVASQPRAVLPSLATASSLIEPIAAAPIRPNMPADVPLPTVPKAQAPVPPSLSVSPTKPLPAANSSARGPVMPDQPSFPPAPGPTQSHLSESPGPASRSAEPSRALWPQIQAEPRANSAKFGSHGSHGAPSTPPPQNSMDFLPQPSDILSGSGESQSAGSKPRPPSTAPILATIATAPIRATIAAPARPVPSRTELVPSSPVPAPRDPSQGLLTLRNQPLTAQAPIDPPATVSIFEPIFQPWPETRITEPTPRQTDPGLPASRPLLTEIPATSAPVPRPAILNGRSPEPAHARIDIAPVRQPAPLQHDQIPRRQSPPDVMPQMPSHQPAPVVLAQTPPRQTAPGVLAPLPKHSAAVDRPIRTVRLPAALPLPEPAGRHRAEPTRLPPLLQPPLRQPGSPSIRSTGPDTLIALKGSPGQVMPDIVPTQPPVAASRLPITKPLTLPGAAAKAATAPPFRAETTSARVVLRPAPPTLDRATAPIIQSMAIHAPSPLRQTPASPRFQPSPTLGIADPVVSNPLHRAEIQPLQALTTVTARPAIYPLDLPRRLSAPAKPERPKLAAGAPHHGAMPVAPKTEDARPLAIKPAQPSPDLVSHPSAPNVQPTQSSPLVPLPLPTPPLALGSIMPSGANPQPRAPVPGPASNTTPNRQSEPEFSTRPASDPPQDRPKRLDTRQPDQPDQPGPASASASTSASPDPAPPTSNPTPATPVFAAGQVAPATQPPMPAERPASLHEGRRLPRGLSASLVRTATRATRDDRVELTLDPVELGKVRFDFTTTNDRMQVNLSVERSDTLDLLRRNADVLRAEFREAGFDGSSLSFSQWSQNSSDKSAANTPISETETAAFTQAAVDPAPRRNTATSGHGLDLRL